MRRFIPQLAMPNGALPRVPDGQRVYAIGDVHGCLDKLESLAWQIKHDAKDVDGEAKVVLLGDYVDRGPHSRETIEYLIAAQRDWGWQLLIGNHDKYLPFSAPPDGGLAHWCRYGGRETLKSYDVDTSGISDEQLEDKANEVVARFRAVAPASHVAFVSSLKLNLRVGDYFFVHAGIRPGVDLSDQTEDDMIFIRSPFLKSEEHFGFVVVHGHTPVDQVDVLSNRIGIDTGAVFGGPLTALVLDGAKRWMLQC